MPWYDLPLRQINIAMYTVYFSCLLLFHVPMTFVCMTMYNVLTAIFGLLFCVLHIEKLISFYFFVIVVVVSAMPIAVARRGDRACQAVRTAFSFPLLLHRRWKLTQ